MKFERASLVLGTLFRVRFVLHWSVAIAFVVFFWFGARLGTFLGVLIIVVAHEIGHVVFARVAGARPEEVLVHGLGGVTRMAGEVGPLRLSVIAWGGIAFQLLLFGLTALLAADLSQDPGGRSALLDTLMYGNFMLAMLNLLPVAPLDGAIAWRIFPRAFGAMTAAKKQPKVRTVEEELEDLKKTEGKKTKDAPPPG